MSDTWAVTKEEPDGWDVASEAPIERRSLGERFSGGVKDEFAQGPMVAAQRASTPGLRTAGSAAPLLNPMGFGGLETLPLPQRHTGAVDTALRKAPAGTGVFDPAAEKARRAALDRKGKEDPWYAVPGTVLDKALAGGATLAGHFTGAAFDPSSWIAPGKGPISRILGAGATNVAADVATQGTDVGADVRDKYDPVQTGFAGALGMGLQGAGEVAGPIIAKGAKKAGDWVVTKMEDAADAAELKRTRKLAATAEAETRKPWTGVDLWAALERQESGGRQEATSEKGARGVAQLMPGTARQVAEWVGNPALAEKAMENTPEGAAVNRWLGQVYLERQMHDFDQDPALALAAYNAGPGRVQEWLKRFGHPSEVGRAKWIEMIPFDETRNYVRTILGNAAGAPVRLADPELKARDALLKEHRKQERAAQKAEAAAEPAAPVQPVEDPALQAAAEAEAALGGRSAEIERELTDGNPPSNPEAKSYEGGERPLSEAERAAEEEFDRYFNTPTEPEPPTRDATDDALDIIRSGGRVEPGEGPSLAEALVKEGGLRDEAGELTHIMGGRGDDRFWKMLRRVNTGKPLDDAALWAWERGYIGKPGGERPHIQELLDAIADEAAGRKRFASENAERRAMAERVEALDEMLRYLGIDPREMSNAEIRQAMDDFMEGAGYHGDEPTPHVEEEYEPGAFGMKRPEEPDLFGGDPNQAAGQLAADLEAKIRERQKARGADPLPEGGLFDETRRGEQDLFGLGGRGEADPGGYDRARAAAERLRALDPTLKGSFRAQPRPEGRPTGAYYPGGPEGKRGKGADGRPGMKEALGAHVQKVKGIRIIAKDLLKRLDLARRQSRVGMKGAAGTYNRKTGMIRTEGMHEIDVVAHEIGHAIEFTKKYPHLLAVMKKFKEFLKLQDYQPKLARRHEGFAEWFRWFITNPEYARDLNPAFYQEFEAAMLADAPNDLKHMMQAQSDYQDFLNAPSFAAAREQVTEPPKPGVIHAMARKVKEGPVQAVQDFADEVYRGVIDHLDPWRRAVKRLDAIYYRNTGKRLDLSVVEDPFKLLRSIPSVASAGHMDVMYGVHGYHELDPDTASLADALTVALGDKFFAWDDAAIRDFGTYLTGRRMVHLYENYRKGLLSQPPDNMGNGQGYSPFWETAVAEAELANPQYAEAAGLIYDWTDALLMKRLNAGLITPEAYRQVREDHPEYVPLFRDVSDREQAGGRRGVDTERQGGLIRLKGSDRAVVNPIHSLMQMAYEVNAAIARNDALKALDDLGRLVGPDGAQIVERLPRKEIKGTKVDALDALDKAANEIGISGPDYEYVRDALGDLFGDDAVTSVYRAVDMTPRAGENVLWVWRDGVKHPLQLPDGKWGRDMIESFAASTPPMTSFALELAAMPARTLRAGVTAHPTFFAANWVRDQFTAAILTDVGYIPGLDNFRGIGAEAGLRSKDLARRYNVVGGEIGGFASAEEHRARGQRDVNALRKNGARIRHFASWEALARTSEVAETGTRLGIFERGLDRAKRDGLDDWAAAKEAAFEARDYMDFDRHGGWTTVRGAARLIPFFNAALQGVDKTLRVAGGFTPAMLNHLFSGRPPSTVSEQRAFNHAVKFWIAASLVATGGMALRAAFEDDPEYQQLADYLRETHWVVRWPLDDDEFLAIPKPYGVAFLSNVMESAFEAIKMQDPTAGHRLKEGLAVMWLPPVDAPMAMLPLELARNRDSFGAPIVPDHMLHTREAKDQKTDSTSELAVGFADMLRKLTFDKKKGTSRIDLSPAQVDYAARSVGGTIARDILRAGDKKAPIEATASESFFTSRFVKNWSRGAVATKEFFKLVASKDGEYTKAAGSFGDAVREGPAGWDRAAADLARMPPAKRAYVMTATFAQGDDKQTHPLIRATEAARELGGLAKDLREGDVLAVNPETGQLEPLRLTPVQRRAAVDGLKKMAVAEQNNALIEAGAGDWGKGRLPLPAEKYAREVERAAPGVMQALSMRFEQAGVMPPEEMRTAWRTLRPQLERDPSPATLRKMMAEKYSSGSGADERILKQVVEAPRP